MSFDHRASTTTGLAAAGLGFLIWGVAPIFFKTIEHVGPWQIIAHRVVWTVPLLLGLLLLLRRLPMLRDAVVSPRRFGIYALNTALVTLNWSVYIWAVLNGYIVESSLGYFINPLVVVLLGVVFLGERLNRLQIAAMALAGLGVVVQLASAGRFPWIAAVLALTWGFYALSRKKNGIDPMAGLLAETLILAPLCLAYLVWLGWTGDGSFGPVAIGGEGLGISLLLIFAGALTCGPIVLYMIGAQRLPLSTLGPLQYVAPSLQFLIGVFVYREPLALGMLITFAFIWAGLLIFTIDLVRSQRQLRSIKAAPMPEPAR
jgi:chloramphenicol-sensitive protein RarD